MAGKIYLALSCLQGRPMQSAAADLMQLNPYGLQLTPGNAPETGFIDWLRKHKVKHILHQGFSWSALRQKVWSNQGECLVVSHSVHPPSHSALCELAWENVLQNNIGNNAFPVLETMYPGYYLGTGEEIEWAMAQNFRLAVDVSHIYIQLCSGLISERVWQRLQDYQHIQEIHVSSNAGNRDSHASIDSNTFGIAWARERSVNVPVVLECYMHKLNIQQRFEQLAALGH